MTNPYITQLSSFIAEYGIEAVQTDLDQLARMARRRGIAVTAAQVMTDRASPAVVRERAFAMVCSALTRQSRRRDFEPDFELATAS